MSIPRNYKKRIGWMILCVAILILFRAPVNKLLDIWIVTPLFSTFELSKAEDVFFLLLCIGYIVWASRRVGQLLLINILFIILPLYLFQRNNEYWEFKLLSYCDMGIAYWDIFITAIVLPVPISFFIRSSTKKRDVDSNDGFVEDTPIEDISQDSFKRRDVAEEIARQISLTNNKKAFAIGILGEYGSGKTSFMNLVIQSLNKQTTTVLYFNPWSSEQVNHIQQDFFDLLVSKLADIDPDISSLLHQYSRKISRVDEGARSWVNRFAFINSFDAGVKTTHKRIDEKLQAIDKKIVIAIDDLDRLYKEEVIEVLRLIRNTVNFSNICYLVAYDKSYVQDAIKELSEKGNHNYLDKIFQIEIPLPKTEQGDLLMLLKGKLTGIISDSHLALFEAKIEQPGLHRDYDKTYANIFRNSRDVVRFINGFKLIYNLIGKEVCFFDLFLLELIKFRFPVVYNAIYERRDHFLNIRPHSGAHKEYFTPRVNDSQSTFYVYLKKEFIDDDIIILNNNLFDNLFNSGLYREPQATDAISYPQHFDVYFRYRLANTDLSERMYTEAVQSDQLMPFIDDCISKSLHDAILTRLLREGQITTRIHFEKIVRALFYLGPKYILEKSRTSFPYDGLAEMIINFQGERVKKLYGNDKESYSRFISDLFENAEPNYLFENGFIKELKEKYAGLVLDNDVLTDYQIAYLQWLVNAKQALSDDGTWLILGIREQFNGEELAGRNTTWSIHLKVYPLLKQAFKNEDPKCFLKSTIAPTINDDQFYIYNEIFELFSSPDELRVWVYKNPYLDKDIKAEYLSFFDSCSNALFTLPVEFNFNTELKKG